MATQEPEELHVYVGFLEGHDQAFIDVLFGIQDAISQLATAVGRLADDGGVARSEQGA